MSTKSRLNKLYKTCQRIRLPEDAKILFVADLHMGDGGPEDDFKKNASLFQAILINHLPNYYLFLLGDIEDRWECPDGEKIHQTYLPIWHLLNVNYAANFTRLKGNHDNSLDYPEAVVLQIGDMEIFCCHGNQGDIFNDKLYWVGKYVVRYFWVPFQWLGLYDLTRAKKRRHELQEARLMKWANERPVHVFTAFGHTHFLGCFGKYNDAGSWVEVGGEGFTFENGKFEERRFV